MSHPTEQIVAEELMAFAIMNRSWIPSSGPVATGFSTNRATPGSSFKTCSSKSRPAWVDPRNIGGLPMMTARGRSFGVMFWMKSTKVWKMRVSWYDETTVESFFCVSAEAARSVAGSTRPTTLRRRPNLLGWQSARESCLSRCAHCSRRDEWFHGPSGEPEKIWPNINLETTKGVNEYQTLRSLHQWKERWNHHWLGWPLILSRKVANVYSRIISNCVRIMSPHRVSQRLSAVWNWYTVKTRFFQQCFAP